MNKEKAYKRFEEHDKDATFLGYTKTEADR
jgi:hypothetical protein